MAVTTKHALRKPAGTDNAFPPEDIGFLADDVDAKMAVVESSTTALRPAAGKLGRWHKATDGTGALVFDTGTVWDEVVRTTDTRLPTTGEAEALAGTAGLPADGNRYVTDDDARNVNQRVPSDFSVTPEKSSGWPKAKVASAVQSILHNQWTKVAFGVAPSFDIGGLFSDPDDGFLVPATGYYLVAGATEWPANSVGHRGVAVTIDNTLFRELEITQRPVESAFGSTFQKVVDIVFLNLNDIVALNVIQSSGGALNVNGTLEIARMP